MWSVGSVDRNIIWNLETTLFVEHSTLNDNSTSIPSACVTYSTSLPPGSYCTIIMMYLNKVIFAACYMLFPY